MIGEITLEALCNQYGIDSSKVIRNNQNVLDFGEYLEIKKVLDYLVKELGISAKNIEKCPSILYLNVNAIKYNYEFLRCHTININNVETCLHVLSTDPQELQKTYSYVLNNYGEKYLNSITSILRVGDSILVIKSDDQQDSVVYYHTPEDIKNDDTEETIYPTKQGLAGIGCISMWGSRNFLDEPVFISKLGLECFTKLNLGLERSIEHKSSMVDTKLVNEPNLEDICLEQWRGYLLCLINGHIYLADNRQKYLNKGTQQQEYEWFYWDNIGDVVNNEFKKAMILKTYDDNLFFGTENGVIAKFTDRVYNDNGRIIYSQWETPFDCFGSENHVKTTNKRGGIANFKAIPGSICKLKERIDKSQKKEITRFVASGFSYTDFKYEDFSYNTSQKMSVIYKIKEKKWTNISLIFYSDELNKPFGIFDAVLEAFIGGYVK